MRMRRTVALGCVAGSLALTGCNFGDSTIAQWRRQPTPMLMTTAETEEEKFNRETIVNDTNLRAFHNDAARALLLDRPSRLSPGPTGGP